MFADWVALRSKLGDLEGAESRLKQRLQQAIGEASGALFETGSVRWKKAKDSRVLDVARLLTEQPELLERYPLIRAGSRRFVVG